MHVGARPRHRPAPRVQYVFYGNVVGDPGAGATTRVGDLTAFGKVPGALSLYRGVVTGTDASHVTINVRGGNLRAAPLLIGQPRTQTFSLGTSTTFSDWVGGLPHLVDATSLRPCSSTRTSPPRRPDRRTAPRPSEPAGSPTRQPGRSVFCKPFRAAVARVLTSR